MGARDRGLAHNTPSYYGEHLCQTILKSLDAGETYSTDKIGRMDKWTDASTLFPHCGDFVSLTARRLDKNPQNIS